MDVRTNSIMGGTVETTVFETNHGEKSVLSFINNHKQELLPHLHNMADESRIWSMHALCIMENDIGAQHLLHVQGIATKMTEDFFETQATDLDERLKLHDPTFRVQTLVEFTIDCININ